MAISVVDQQQIDNPNPLTVAMLPATRKTPTAIATIPAAISNPLHLYISVRHWQSVFCLDRGQTIDDAKTSGGDGDDHWNPAASVNSNRTTGATKEKTLPDLKKETLPKFSILTGSDQQ
ncbi:hypothetical protein ACLOJK_041184 [Asimina triloba]